VGALAQEVQKDVTATGEEFNQLDDRYDDESLDEATSDEPACNNIGG
jgi:hypothetical protein